MRDKKQDKYKSTETPQETGPEGESPGNQENRRNAVKTALAGGVILAGTSAPAQWATPLVRGVILPAHASTSSAAPISAPCSQITLQDRVVTCGGATLQLIELCTFSIVEGCLHVTVTEITDLDGFVPQPNQFLILITMIPGVVAVGAAGLTFNEVWQQSCDPITPDTSSSSKSETILVDGDEYQVEFTLTKTTTDPVSVSITNITVTPAA